MIRPILAITMGDPAGIGPEIILKALANDADYSKAIPVIYGDQFVLRDAARMCGLALGFRSIQLPADAIGVPGTVECIDLRRLSREDYHPGKTNAACGDAAYQYIVRAIDAAAKGEVAGIVTAPICKEALHQAGHMYAGHTEIFAAQTGVKRYAMLLMCRSLRVIHCTTHASIRNACDLVRQERVYDVIHLAAQALQTLGIARGRIAVAGLNPHASENGLFGSEEKEEILPAIQRAQAEGIPVTGPLPPDTVFVKALGGQYDMVVAMYHDQGHIPLKMAGFQMDASTGRFASMCGVNITVGLPILRVSVDHGTAFDIAGSNSANPQSMLEAMRIAAQMAPHYAKKGENNGDKAGHSGG